MAGMSLKGKGILTSLYTCTEENCFNFLLCNKESKRDGPHCLHFFKVSDDTVIKVRLNCVDSLSRLDQ